MPHKSASEDGVKSKGRKGSDKARRNFELNGTYTAKHLRLLADRNERTPAQAAGTEDRAKRKGKKK